MIRPATLEDVPRLVEFARALLRTAYAGIFADVPAVVADTITALATGDHTTVLVLEGEAGVVGGIGLIAQPSYVSGELIVAEVFWYVDPAARGAGVRLLRAAEAWAQARGAVGIQMAAPNARVAAVYERWGYQGLERSYLRRFDAA